MPNTDKDLRDVQDQDTAAMDVSAGSGGFTFDTWNERADFNSQRDMTAVPRKESFLENEPITYRPRIVRNSEVERHLEPFNKRQVQLVPGSLGFKRHLDQYKRMQDELEEIYSKLNSGNKTSSVLQDQEKLGLRSKLAGNGKSEDDFVSSSDDDIWAVSGYNESIASIFSDTYFASSASELSKASEYSATQIAAATKELLAIFYQDPALVLLYKNAIENPDIGPGRLQRNLRRIIKAYARQLENEASDRLEFLASRLVLLKADFLAQAVVVKFGAESVSRPEVKADDSSGDEEDEEAREFDETSFHDLVAFRIFLVESPAFLDLRYQLRKFIADTPKEKGVDVKATTWTDDNPSVPRPSSGTTIEVQTFKNRRTLFEEARQTLDGILKNANEAKTTPTVSNLLLCALFLATDNFMMYFGILEPALQSGMLRLRWQCSCGDSLFSDIKELREGGVARLVNSMQRASNINVSVTGYSSSSSNRRYVLPRPIQWLRNAITKIFSAVRKSTQTSAGLPQHRTANPGATTTPHGSSQPEELRLLACMHRNKTRRILHQDCLNNVATDLALIDFLRRQYSRHRGRLLHMLSLRTVKGILLIRFRLPIGGSVDVQYHDPCCLSSMAAFIGCQCIPPKVMVEPSPTAEYRCIPGPPDTSPPFPPEFLAALFTCSADVHKDDTWILNQFPRRKGGELQGKIGQPAQGWGIYYQEGYDRDIITLAVFLLFLVGSLLFGLLWSRYKYDVQGAFGVSAYMMAAGTSLISVVPVLIEKFG